MILGLDGGSTKTLSIVFDEDEMKIKGIGISGPSNYTNTDVNVAEKNIEIAVRKACDDASVNIEEIQERVFGLAGVGDSEEATKTGIEIAESIVGNANVVNDGYAAYKTGNLNEDGIVFAPGTGSVGYVKKGEKMERFGGWGWFIGDEASASWIAKRALLYGMRESDGMIQSSFRKEIEDYFGYEIRETAYKIEKGLSKRIVAGFAPRVSAMAMNGNQYAIEIFEEAASYITKLINAKSYQFEKEPKISLLGGTMLSGSFYTDMIRKGIKHKLSIFFGYQVAIGDVIYAIEKKKSVNEKMRNDMIAQLNDAISNHMNDAEKFLMIKKLPESQP
ncbi:MAG: BadF/BadG/BcrA/BcrD ATPase family protein [Thermoplasmata archaeon]